jgi:RHS repeat-associated protein
MRTVTTPYDENGSPQTATLTAYYFGGAYEVTDGVAKSYYNFAGQTIMKDSNGDLSYFLTDHLGSVVAVTDEEGDLISQQRYLPFGGVRTNVTTPNSPNTDYGYTGQRNLDDEIGLMDYKARFYSPYLNRFIQPDSIVPNMMMPQMFNRFSYVGNNPINFNDPTGHLLCDADGFCDQNWSVNQQNHGGNSLMGCRLDCTIEDLDGANMEERLDWFRWLTNHMDGTIGDGTSEWFNNIDTVVGSFVWSGQDDNQWMLMVDANILLAVQDGYASHLGLYNGAIAGGSGAHLWMKFFDGLINPEVTQDQLVSMWGAAEQAGTNEGFQRATELGFGGGTWKSLNWMMTDYGLDDLFFSGIGNMYRGSSKFRGPACGISEYFIDYLGYSTTGH